MLVWELSNKSKEMPKMQNGRKVWTVCAKYSWESGRNIKFLNVSRWWLPSSNLFETFVKGYTFKIITDFFRDILASYLERQHQKTSGFNGKQEHLLYNWWEFHNWQTKRYKLLLKTKEIDNISRKTWSLEFYFCYWKKLVIEVTKDQKPGTDSL